MLSFYRSASDEDAFAKHYGEKCIADKEYLDYLTKHLYELTDTVDSFLKKEKAFTAQNYKKFFELFDEHFSYHLVNFWAGDSIMTMKGENDPRYLQLYKARAYNEHVLPAIEDWIRTQGEMSFMTPEEIENKLVSEKIVGQSELENRKVISFLFWDKETFHLSSGKEARSDFQKLDTLISDLNKKFIGEIGEVKGIAVYKGKHTGKVRIINDFSKFHTIESGEVLITPMTRPHFNEYITKAGAIVTDEGAMLCHAAIVAREFKIPTVVGTKVATFVFKDGDMVEVDAERGIIKRI
jgi:phosphohistidine swiveling domain-containing protein